MRCSPRSTSRAGNGVKVAYDTNYRPRLWPPARAAAVMHAAMAETDYALPGIEDAQTLTGLTDPDAMLDFYLRLGPQVVVLKMGEAGAYLATPEHRVRIPRHAVQVVDATGAGDAFCGSFLARILAGDSPEQAARYANVAAALKCTGYGAVAPIPHAAGRYRGHAGSHRPCVNAVSVCHAAVCWAPWQPRWLPPPARHHPPRSRASEALRRLMEGNARYRANQTHARDFAVGPRRTRHHASTDRLGAELLGRARRVRNSCSTRGRAICSSCASPATCCWTRAWPAWNTPPSSSARR